MTGVPFQLPRRPLLALLGLLLLATPILLAQVPGGHNEIEAKHQGNVQDREGIYVLDFRFTTPRLITVDVPGRGGKLNRKLCWYLLYRVINNTKESRTFIPDFELVTADRPHVYHDEVLPRVQDAIQRIEDPTGHLDIKNSVTMAALPIPPSKPNATPRSVNGVAIWTEVNPDTTRFNIFVSGLSNGWSVDDKEVVRRKTLQLNFRRLGDRNNPDSRDIRFVPPAEWVYRASGVKTPEPPPPAPAKPAAPGENKNPPEKTTPGS